MNEPMDLKTYSAALREQWERRHSCPSCGRTTYPVLECDWATGEYRYVDRCHLCGYVAKGGKQ